jgi:hypothetical protein
MFALFIKTTMAFKKIDNNNFSEIETQETIYNIEELQERKKGLQNDIIRIQEEIAQIDALLLEAGKLGIEQI